MPSINLAEVKGLEPIPPGIYLASITKAEESVSQKGNEMINCQWTVEHEDDPKIHGRILFDSLVWHEKSLFRIKQVLEAAGFDDDWEGEVTPEMLIGVTANLIVDIETSTQIDESTGEPYPPRNRVKRVKPVQ